MSSPRSDNGCKHWECVQEPGEFKAEGCDVSIIDAPARDLGIRFVPQGGNTRSDYYVTMDRRALVGLADSIAAPSPDRARDAGAGTLRLVALVLPPSIRGDWLEEHRAYLDDLTARPARVRWLCREVRGMLRYAYTVRTSGRKELA